MKVRKLSLAVLGVAVSLSSASCSLNKQPSSNTNQPSNVLDVTLNQSPSTIANDDLGYKIMEGIAKKGCDMIKGKAFAWGKKLCSAVLESIGIPLFDTDPSDLILDKLEAMEDSLKSIQAALSQALSKIDQNESTRILDNFMDKFNELKVSVSPVMSGLATFVDEERKANGDEALLEKIEKDEEKFYTDYVSSLKKSGNSFSERVILLADSIVKPSTNAEYNLLRCFDLSVMDSNPRLQWNTQRIQPKYEYFTYISSLLLTSLSIARFEIAYKLKMDTSVGGQAMWKKVESDLNDAVEPALTKLQSFYNDTKKEEEAIQNGDAIFHVKSGIKVSAKMEILSLSDTNTVLSYKDTYTSYPAAGGRETGYQRKTLHTPENLTSVLVSGYNDYLNADNLKSSDFSFYKYLDEIGFWTKGSDSSTVGIWNKAFTTHEGNTFINEYDYFKTEYIDRQGIFRQHTFGTVVDKVLKKAYYESNSHLYDKYLVFLEPGAKKVFGDYETIDFASVSRGHQTMLKENNFPGTLDYKAAVNDGSLGKVA